MDEFEKLSKTYPITEFFKADIVEIMKHCSRCGTKTDENCPLCQGSGLMTTAIYDNKKREVKKMKDREMVPLEDQTQSSFFKFKEYGDTLKGIWSGVKDGKYGENGLIKQEGADTETSFTLNVNLQRLKDVKVGTFVSIQYVGDLQSASGKTYKKFNITREKGEVIPF